MNDSRLSYGMQTTTQDYFPYGSVMPGRYSDPDKFRFGFNGKEMVNELYESTGSAYDFGARMYDSRLGRWMARDPLASIYPAWSPYNSFENNPVFFIDPTGKGAEVTKTTDENGQPVLKVTCTIYVYSDVAEINENLAGYASDIKQEIESQWNGATGTAYDKESSITYKVVFDVNVVPVTSMDKLAELQEKEGSDPSVNFVHLNNATDPNNTAYSFFEGNSGSWSVLPSRRRYSFAHEFGHLLGWRIFDPDNKKWDTHHYDHNDLSIMQGNKQRRVTPRDVKRINGGNGILDNNAGVNTGTIKGGWYYRYDPLPNPEKNGYIRRQHKNIGEPNNNKTFKNDDVINEYRKSGEDHGDYTFMAPEAMTGGD